MSRKIFNFIILFTVVMFFNVNQTLAQIIDPTDTVDVPWDTGGNIGSLNATIMGDTLSNGARRNPEAVYRLARNKIYFINGALSNDETWHLHIVAAKPADPSNPNAPPVIMSGILDDGSRANIPIWAGGNLTLRGIWFYHYTPVQGQNQATSYDGSIFSLANGSRNVITGNIFDGAHVCISARGDWQDWLIEDNIARNCISSDSWYIGHFINYEKVPADTVIIRNNTMFNNGGFTCSVTLENYLLFEHNTIFGNHVNPLIASGDWNGGTNRDIKNNIFYATFNKGIKDAINVSSVLEPETWTCSDGYYWAVTDIDTLSEYQRDSVMQMSEADRYINWENNVYYWPQVLKDVYAKHADSLIAPRWANEHTEKFFNDPNYPNLNMSGNVEADPGFNADMMVTMANTAKYVEGFIVGYPSGRWPAETPSNYLHKYPNIAAGDTNYAWYPPFTHWPLGEDLSYSNTSLQNAGTDGFAIGDLNWFPDQKKQWLLTGVEQELTGEIIPSKFELSQNYPNPFNPSTKIKYSVPKASRITLNIFNALGQKVVEIVDQQQNPGKYQITFDASSLASGLYFYTLKTNEISITKKMMLLK